MPKNSRDHFYYQQTKSRIKYGAKPSGHLSVKRFLQHKPYWIQPGTTIENKKRTIIIADWSVNYWAIDKREAVINKINAFLIDGFTVELYRFCEQRCIPLTDRNTVERYLDRYTNHKDKIDIFESKSVVTAQICQHKKISPDHCLILDDKDINDLIADILLENTQARSLILSELSNLKKENYVLFQAALQFFSTLNPPITHLHHNLFHTSSNKMVFELQSIFIDAEIVFNFTGLCVDFTKLEELYETGAIYLDNVEFKYSQIPDIKYLFIRGTIKNTALVTHAIEQIKELKKISIPGIQFSESIAEDALLQSITPHVATLIDIDFAYSNVTMEILNFLMFKAIHLKSLVLSDCSNLHIPVDDIPELLMNNSVKQLNLSNSNITHENLIKLIKLCPFTTQLNISGVNFIFNDDNDFFLQHGMLYFLEKIIFQRGHFKNNQFETFINVLKNECRFLSALDLSNTVIESRMLNSTTSEKFTFISKLNLSHSTITPGLLNQLLMDMPTLTFINLSDTKLMGESLSLPMYYLKMLSSIDLSNATISEENFCNLFVAAPHIKNLILVSTHITSHNNTQGLKKRTIELIKLSSFIINNICSPYDSLEDLLNFSHSLKSFYSFPISFYQSISEKNSKNYRSLEDLHLDNDAITNKTLENILSNSKKLKKLTLSRCNQFTQENLHLDNIVMKHLIELDLYDTTITNANKSLILQKSENIESCILQWMPNMEGLSLPDDFKLLNLKQLNIQADNFNLDVLNELLEKMPNLTKLKFESLSKIEGTPLVLKLNSLMSLKTITFQSQNSRFTYHQLEALIGAAPYLIDEDRDEIESLNDIKDSNTVTSLPHCSPPINTELPAHDSSKYFGFKPPNKTFKFKNQFHGLLNQGMVIEKFSQYLKLSQQFNELIPKIQAGICSALCHLFQDLPISVWQYHMTNLSGWYADDLASCPEEIVCFFNQIKSYIYLYQLNQGHIKTQYIGENFLTFVESSDKKVFILSNPWHAITIKKISDDEFIYYDPNNKEGIIYCEQYELAVKVKHSIGKLVHIELSTEQEAHLPLIDLNTFIQEGGLLSLVTASNANFVISKLRKKHDWLIDELNGILLRTISGIPAWATCLLYGNPATAALCMHLLEVYLEKNEIQSVNELIKSMECLTNFQKHVLTEKLLERSRSNSKIAFLLHEFYQKDREDYNEKFLTTWKRVYLPHISFNQCAQQLFSLDFCKKRLIEFSTSDKILLFQNQLKQYAQSTSRPVFIINSADDLVCQAPYIKRNKKNNTGKLCKGPGGSLYDFLNNNKNNYPVLIINYDNFSTEEMIKFNSLLDNTAAADGIPLPINTKIIGLQNTAKPNVYQGSDFYSRFDITEPLPIASQQLSPPTFSFVDNNTLNKPYIINLYHSSNWQEQLLGGWVLDGNTLVFQEGELTKAINSAKPIQINQGFFGTTEFDIFIKNNLPASVSLIKPIESYDWEKLSQCVTPLEIKNEDIHILNPNTFSEFFEKYECDEKNKLLYKKNGIIKLTPPSTTLQIHLTRELTDDHWAKILNEAINNHILLNISTDEGIHIPEFIQSKVTVSTNPLPQPIQITYQDSVICSDDPDVTIAQIKSHEPNTIVIDVTDLLSGELLGGIDGHFDEKSLEMAFEKKSSVIFDEIAKGNNIILTGDFSDELADMLAPVFFKRMIDTTDKPQKLGRQLGKVTIVSSKQHTDKFKYHPNSLSHHVSVDEKKIYLKDPNIFSETIVQNTPLCHLQAMITSIDNDRASPWQGMFSIDKIQFDTPPLDKSTALTTSQQFINQRKKQLNDVLSTQPYVFISGVSGVGKSSFVRHDFCEANDVLFEGNTNLKNWALALKDGEEINESKRKILFIDEANLADKNWSEFEGLFQTPQTILIDGKNVTLTDNHKVVFAGNPLNYGDERTQARLFSRHGNAVLFEPLPKAFLYEKTLKPIFENKDIYNNALTYILDIYQTICSYSSTEILISPRELQMMALLIRSQPIESIDKNFQNICYDIANNCVPENRLSEFDALYKPIVDPVDKDIYSKINDFIIPPSRQACVKQISDLLLLREFRQREEHRSNPNITKGGLGGIILEGEPGIGKSVQVIQQLHTMGYQREIDLNNPTTLNKPYYLLPVSMPLEEKEKLLLKAFDEGAVVIFDEINASPMMENLLNDLLMGERPKTMGMPQDQKPGFMIIGTQNPITMSGRRAPSTALQRRLITSKIPSYTEDEMINILFLKGVPIDEAQRMVTIYQTKVLEAKADYLTPAPTFRSLEKLADLYLSTTPPEIRQATYQKQCPRCFSLTDNIKQTFFRNMQSTHLPFAAPTDIGNHDTKTFKNK